MSSEDSQPPFDQKMAVQYIGKYVLIGISIYDSKGIFVRQEQIHGIITKVSEKTGITVDLKGVNEGATRDFPPNIQSLSIAKKGEYSLRQTGEVIEDPDLLWTWNITDRDIG
jgi:hypothetical protein